MPAGKSDHWPKERIDKLIALCSLDPRPSVREIAKECGVTRYAAIAKIHRLNLSDPRKNPILNQKPKQEKPYQPPVYGRKPTLPVLESLKDL